MIGQTIESRPRLPLGVMFWLLAAIVLDVHAAVQQNADVAIGSLLPWLAAMLLWRIRERPFTARFTETAVEVDEPPLTMRYADLQGLLAPRRPANPFKAGPHSYLIQVIHASGVLLIPRRLTVHSDEVFSFLYRQFSPSGSREVPPTLTAFVRRKEHAFGPERVWTYRARVHGGKIKEHPRLTAFFLSLSLAAVIWIIWGLSQKQEGWIVCGTVNLVLGILFTLGLWLAGRQRLVSIRGRRQAGLVIAPDGLALAQGDMIGELRWDEVRDVKLGKSAGSFQLTTTTQPQRGIVLKVEGAAIVIADIYDRPLGLIHQNICHYWRSQSLGNDGDREAMPRLFGEQNRAIVSGLPLPPSSEGITPPQ